MNAFSEAFGAKNVLLLVCLLVGSLASGPANASDWPDRTVRIVVPYAPGGTGDTLGRLIAKGLSATFKQPFIIENRPGASGIIGTLAAAHAAPDGYTLTVSSISAYVFAPSTQETGYDPVKDFTHIAYFGGPPIVLAANPSLGVKTYQDLRALLKSGKDIDFDSPGVGSLGHLVPEFIARKDHVKLTHIPYKGSSSALRDLVGGQVPLGSLTWTTALSQIQAGKIIALALTSAHRLPSAPQTPTFAELGYPEMVVTTWYGLSGPAGLAPDIVKRLNREVSHALTQPEVKAYLDSQGIQTEPMTSAAYTSFVQTEYNKWRPIVDSVGLGRK